MDMRKWSVGIAGVYLLVLLATAINFAADFVSGTKRATTGGIIVLIIGVIIFFGGALLVLFAEQVKRPSLYRPVVVLNGILIFFYTIAVIGTIVFIVLAFIDSTADYPNKYVGRIVNNLNGGDVNGAITSSNTTDEGEAIAAPSSKVNPGTIRILTMDLLYLVVVLSLLVIFQRGARKALSGRA